MSSRKTARIAACAAVLALAAPASASALTKVVTMGPPPAASKQLQKMSADVNDFFPHGITIHVGDKIRFEPMGFHTVDFPARGGGRLSLIAPTGQMASSTDAAGNPFWFNGQPVLGFNPALVKGKFGKTVSYSGAARAESGAPLSNGRPKPFTVRFTKAGNYTYFCDVHVGMRGVVHVAARSHRIPTAKADRAAVNRQVARDVKQAKTLTATKPPANTVDVGSAGPNGVEVFAFFPSTLTVPKGTTVQFRMTKSSFEDHTATTGPGNPESQPTSYLGTLAASFNSPAFDPRATYSSEPPGGAAASLTPTLHGNGFWNAGVMDTTSATPLPASNSVTFGAPGTYQFYCLIHPFMHGTVKVT